MNLTSALRRGIGAALLGLAVVASGCAAKIPIDVAPAGGPERLVIDTRGPEAFAAGHAPGALNIQLGWDQLEDRTKSYLPDLERPIALRASSLSEAQEGAAVLQELGYTDVTLFSGEASTESATMELMMAKELEAILKTGGAPMVIDIRQESEFKGGVIGEALLVDQDAGPAAVEGLDKSARYLIICEGGYRSSQLASWMRIQGFQDVVNVIDGMSGWRDL